MKIIPTWFRRNRPGDNIHIDRGPGDPDMHALPGGPIGPVGAPGVAGGQIIQPIGVQGSAPPTVGTAGLPPPLNPNPHPVPPIHPMPGPGPGDTDMHPLGGGPHPQIIPDGHGIHQLGTYSAPKPGVAPNPAFPNATTQIPVTDAHDLGHGPGGVLSHGGLTDPLAKNHHLNHPGAENPLGGLSGLPPESNTKI